MVQNELYEAHTAPGSLGHGNGNSNSSSISGGGGNSEGGGAFVGAGAAATGFGNGFDGDDEGAAVASVTSGGPATRVRGAVDGGWLTPNEIYEATTPEPAMHDPNQHRGESATTTIQFVTRGVPFVATGAAVAPAPAAPNLKDKNDGEGKRRAVAGKRKGQAVATVPPANFYANAAANNNDNSNTDGNKDDGNNHNSNSSSSSSGKSSPVIEKQPQQKQPQQKQQKKPQQKQQKKPQHLGGGSTASEARAPRTTLSSNPLQAPAQPSQKKQQQQLLQQKRERLLRRQLQQKARREGVTKGSNTNRNEDNTTATTESSSSSSSSSGPAAYSNAVLASAHTPAPAPATATASGQHVVHGRRPARLKARSSSADETDT